MSCVYDMSCVCSCPRLLCRLELSCESFVQGTACRASSAGAVRRAAPHGVPLCTAARQSAGQGPAFVLGVAHTAASPPPRGCPLPPAPLPQLELRRESQPCCPRQTLQLLPPLPPTPPPKRMPPVAPHPTDAPCPPAPPRLELRRVRASSVVLPLPANPCPHRALPSASRDYPPSASRYSPRVSRTACTRIWRAGKIPGGPRRPSPRRGDGIVRSIEPSFASHRPPLRISRTLSG